MIDLSNTFSTLIPESVWKHIPFIDQHSHVLGEGNNAVVLYDIGTGDVVKLYGHKDLLQDPYINARITRHFASEVIALEKLSSLQGIIPTIKDYGRIHESAYAGNNWFMPNVYGWIRMNYMDGIRQDKIANEQFGGRFKDNQRNDAFYYSVGVMLGRLHTLGANIKPSQIQHDIHENDLVRALQFTELQLAKWEAGLTAEQFKDKEQFLKCTLRAYEESYEVIKTFRGSYGFTHGDFASRNMLYDEYGGQITVRSVLDFGEAGIGLPEHDFIPMALGDKPAAIAGYESTGAVFSPQRHDAIMKHSSLEQRIIKLAKV